MYFTADKKIFFPNVSSPREEILVDQPICQIRCNGGYEKS